MSNELSTFDRYAQRRRDEQAAQQEERTDVLTVPRGYGGFVGKIAIVAGVIFLFPSSGLSAFLIVAGAIGWAAQKTVTTPAYDAMDQAADDHDKPAVDRAFLRGLLGMLGWLVVAGLVVMLMLAMVGIQL